MKIFLGLLIFLCYYLSIFANNDLNIISREQVVNRKNKQMNNILINNYSEDIKLKTIQKTDNQIFFKEYGNIINNKKIEG